MELKRWSGCGLSLKKTPFNRTSMELKPVSASCSVGSVAPFNRTSMELKLQIESDSRGVFGTFNRTSMELKPLINLFNPSLGGTLLIGPVWN